MSKCVKSNESLEIESKEVQSFAADIVDVLRQSSIAALSGFPVIKKEHAQPISRIHLVASGDILMSSVAAAGNEGDVVLRGSIGPFPYEIHLKIKLEGAKVYVTFDMQKPIDLPPYTWAFDLHGVTKDASGNIIGASDVKPSADVVAAKVDFWCILKCGGAKILACIWKCLPSLGNGPQAFISCVIECAGQIAAEIAVCIATKCI